jgi:hypothetical protein
MHLLITPQDQAPDLLQRAPKGVTYEKIIRETEDRFGDQHLATWYQDQPKTETQIVGESLQEFVTAIEQMTHCALSALPENHGRQEAGMTFVDGIQEQRIKQQLPLGGRGTLKEVLTQALGLGGITLTDGTSIGLQKTSDRALWRRRSLPKWQKRLPTAYVLEL